MNFIKLTEADYAYWNSHPHRADSKLVDDLKADSLDIVELVTSLEEEYNIEISDEDIKNIRTVGDVVRFIESK